MIIGTAGHVDHGKTALVKALTGVDADRLPEEKRRGITLDLGYAYTGDLGFVDVPGHERLVHTMLAGAGAIDAALLVVAADDGVMPQTREHAQILDLLGIGRGVVAITKIDVATERVPAVAAQIRGLLAGTGLQNAPIQPVSALTGEGIPDLFALLRALDAAPRGRDAYPRLTVDRAFTLAGAGLVVTGTLVSGRIAVEDRLVLSPGGYELRVRGLHAQNRPAATAVAGQRVALNIVGAKLSKDVVARGDWVLHPEIDAPTPALDASIRLLPGVAALRADTQVHVHLAAAHVTGRLAPLDRPRLEPDGTGLARLTLDRAIGALAGDRLVLRDARAAGTIGGGVVVDPFPPHRGRARPARLAQLDALREADPVSALRALLAQPPGWIDFPTFARARNLPPDRQAAVLAGAPAIRVAELALAPANLVAWRADIVRRLAEHHTAAPDQPGLQPERLRLALPGRLPASAFRAVLETTLRRGEVEQDGPWLRLPAHRAMLSPQDERTWEQVHRLLAAQRFRPPRTRDLANLLSVPEATMRALLKRLLRMGRLIEVAHDHFFLRETVAEMVGVAAALAEADPRGAVTAAQFRDGLDNGRKVAIQILEFFDRSGITHRSGDERRIRRDRLDLFGAPPAKRSAA